MKRIDRWTLALSALLPALAFTVFMARPAHASATYPCSQMPPQACEVGNGQCVYPGTCWEGRKCTGINGWSMLECHWVVGYGSDGTEYWSQQCEDCN